MRITPEQIKEYISAKGMVSSFVELQDSELPYQKFTEIVDSINNGLIKHAVYYDPSARHTILSKKEKIFTDLLGNFLFLIPLAYIILAIFLKQYILLFGIMSFVIAMFVCNPWAKKFRDFLSIISLICFVVALFINIYISLIFLGFLVSSFLTVFSRELVNNIVKREALKSESLFCYLYQVGVLILKDTDTNKIYHFRKTK